MSFKAMTLTFLQSTTWIVFGAIGVAIQLALLVAAMWTIWPLRMSLSKKATCSAYFGLPLL